jgi:hypothetical protein
MKLAAPRWRGETAVTLHHQIRTEPNTGVLTAFATTPTIRLRRPGRSGDPPLGQGRLAGSLG